MLEAFSIPRNRNRTLILLTVCGALGVAAGAVGISDNLPGVLLAFLSACAFVVAVVHPWKASKQFRRVLYASALGFLGFVVLHNVLEAVASNVDGFVHDLLGGASAVVFVAATLLCPAGVLVGAVGAVVMSRREHHSLPGASSA